jgi:hypothetical protein
MDDRVFYFVTLVAPPRLFCLHVNPRRFIINQKMFFSVESCCCRIFPPPFQVVQTNCQVTINQQSKSKVICSLPSCHIDIGLVPTLDFYFFFSILWCWGSPHSKSVENWNFDLTCLLLLERNQLLDQYTWHFLLHHTARTKDEKWITTTDVWCDVSSLMRVWCWGWMSVY